MTFNEYQKKAKTTLLSSGDELLDVLHMALGISGESGEVSEKLKKIIRDNNGDLSKLDLESLKKELGDVLWHLAVMAELLGISFDEIATLNIEKLASRKKRGVLKGSGSDR